jgi:hypothetical protein
MHMTISSFPSRLPLLVLLSMLQAALLSSTDSSGAPQDPATQASREVRIINERTGRPRGRMAFDFEIPCRGENVCTSILNVHFYPGLGDYQDGNFSYAVEQLDYFLARPQYTQMHPYHRSFMSIGHYTRGMIYLYHASGGGRLQLAKTDFEQAISWDSRNYLAQLELAEVYSQSGAKDKAQTMLEDLLQGELDPETAALVRTRLGSLQTSNPSPQARP